MTFEESIKQILNSNSEFEQIAKLDLTPPAIVLVESLKLDEFELTGLLEECSKSCSNETIFPSSLTAFRLYSCLAKLNKLNSPRFPFLAHLTCDDDIFVMAKVFVETAKIKYNTMSDEWYEACPAVLATIGQAYRSMGGIMSEELYNFEEHILKCILKHAETTRQPGEQTVETLLTCILENPYLSSIPISQILG